MPKTLDAPPKNGKTSVHFVELVVDHVAEGIAEYVVHPRNQLNDLDATQWIARTVTVWQQKGLGAKHEDTWYEKQHPAPFSYQDVQRLIEFFTKKGDTVLDPFAGVGSTAKAALLAGRKSVNIEINPEFADLAIERIEKEVPVKFVNQRNFSLYEGDAREVAKQIKKGSVDFIVTSPPYWNILAKADHKVQQVRTNNGLATDYGNLEGDLSQIATYEGFLNALTTIFTDLRKALAPSRYLAIVVGDFRHKSRYYMFHADLAARLEENGYELKGIKILYQSKKKVFPYGYPYSYVPNMHHQYILILQRADD